MKSKFVFYVPFMLSWIYRDFTVDIVGHMEFLQMIQLCMLGFVLDMVMNFWKHFYANVIY